MAAAALCGALILEACGLPSNVPSLGAPVVPSSANPPASSNIFTFDNGTQTAPSDLYGFEIYYKFYDDNGSTGHNGVSAYQADTAQLSATETGPTQLVSLGYRRAYLVPLGYQEGTQITQPATPAIPISDATLKSTTFQVTMDFSGAFQGSTQTNFYPQVDLNGSPIVLQSAGQTGNLAIARYFAISDSPFTSSPGNFILQGFGYNDFANDQGTDNGQSPTGDIPSSITDQQLTTTPQALVLGLFAIAYGLVDFTTPIYSTPTALGYIHYYSATFTTQSDPTPP